ncbi:MAG: undecaprenyldiphospho-muramoylpentapeptide beta-N-acetylglucosaminyltransferase [Rikenellaceae bacterium]|nr:undecaprenyldiphospho-muramoylpentapeptide beta-N-acetylglucosaminyltransferase [Rikenellaceae bacterium]
MLKIILSGGGTGGHIYPAVSVAEELKKRAGDNVEILFVGAEGKMEMEKIPASGYSIIGLPVAGLQRRLTVKNLSLPFKVIKSLNKAISVIKSFKPDIVVGFGGYASAPILWAAQRGKIPTVIQEQNSYAGITNKILAKRADRVCVAYKDMDRFFDKNKIVLTGNPVRANFIGEVRPETAAAHFGLIPEKQTILVTGGSLGTRTLNNAVLSYYDQLKENNNIQLIWQTGKFYENEIGEAIKGRKADNIWHGAFIDRMDYAYEASDVIIARAGASTVSELSLIGKPVIFVPSPNVAEDHQTKNAMALSSVGAAELIRDSDATEQVIPYALELLKDKEKMARMGSKITSLGINDSAKRIVDIILSLISQPHV